VIEIYVKNVNGTYFATALMDGEILRSTFSAGQETTVENVLGSFALGTPVILFSHAPPWLNALFAALRDIYDGKEVNFKFALAASDLPDYTQKVLKATASIPAGYVTSYGAIAKAVGGGARAVGNVMASNPFPPIVPCHRVVKSDLGLGGYGAGGLRVKLEFLMREQRGFSEPREIDVGGGCLRVFPVEYVLRKYA
jgi:methylated-DNA-[protein]-cysteine S-methyltransferase